MPPAPSCFPLRAGLRIFLSFSIRRRALAGLSGGLLQLLRDRWVAGAREIPGVQVLTPDDPALHAGITSFRLAGRTTTAANVEVRKALFERYRIFTVERGGPARGACVRVTPSFVNGPADVDALVAALRDLART